MNMTGILGELLRVFIDLFVESTVAALALNAN